MNLVVSTWLLIFTHTLGAIYAEKKQDHQCDLVPPEPTDRFAKICPMTSKCPGQRAFTAAFTARGCFCDSHCRLYRDCCDDYTSYTDTAPLLPETFTCRRVDGVWSNNLPVYIVDKCPASWKKDSIRRKCENSATDPFLNWPLSDDRDVLYKNIFCYKCNANPTDNVHTWISNILCNEVENTKVSAKDVLKDWKAYSCNLTFTHPDKDHSLRKCKANINSCPATWVDDCTRKLCESPTASVQYRYDPASREKAFKNPFCALCHNSSSTCEDVVTKKYMNMKLYSQVYGEKHALSLSIDMNLGEIVERRLGEVTQRMNLTSCQKGYVYDVFSDSCVASNGPFNLSAMPTIYHSLYCVNLLAVLYIFKE